LEALKGLEDISNHVNPDFLEVIGVVSEFTDFANFFLNVETKVLKYSDFTSEMRAESIIKGTEYFTPQVLLEAAIQFGMDGPIRTRTNQFLNGDGNNAGAITLSAPTFMGDGDAEYSVSLSGVGRGVNGGAISGQRGGVITGHWLG
jgi:hypothetical protein